MRLGLVVYDGLDRTTGGYLYDRTLVEHWREAGHEVEVVAVPHDSYVGGLLDNLDADLRDRLVALDVDVLLEDELCHPSLVWHNCRLGEDTPIVAIVHHLLSSEPQGRLRRALFGAVERRYLRTVDGFVFNSRATHDSVVDRVGSVEGVVAPPAGDRFGSSVDLDRIDERAHESGPLRVAFVGSVVPRKGLDTLVEAIARQSADIDLTVVGDPTTDPAYHRRVRRLVADSGLTDTVSFAGRLSDEALAARLRESHVLAVPSTYEGFGIVYLEGMSFGLPAVASRAGGATDVVTDGETGVLVDPDDATAVAAALTRLADTERLAAMGRAARRRYERHPGWAESAARVRELLTDVASTPEVTP